MKNLGLCTHFTDTDEWAFEYALQLAQTKGWQLNICHWLESPYKMRRDIVYKDMLKSKQPVIKTPKILNKLELQLREYYEPKLGEFTDVAFKLCEGFYQVELVRCFRQNLLDLVAIGYQSPREESLGLSMDEFATKLQFPIIIVGHDGPGTYLLNEKAYDLLDQLMLPAESWSVVEPVLH